MTDRNFSAANYDDYSEFDDYDEFPDRFVVMAHRSGGSVFGAATAPCKGKNGQVEYYTTRKSAEAAAKKYNAQTTSINVRYSVSAA